jgi:hypothetical protein
MSTRFRLLILTGLLVTTLLGCGGTPVPTSPPQPQAPAETTLPPTQPPPTSVATKAASTPFTPRPTPTSEGPTASPAAPSPTATSPKPSEVPSSTIPAAPPTPTATAQLALKYPAPVLLNPPDGVLITWNYTALLEWGPVGKLAPDEYYDLQLDAYLETTGKFWYGDYVYTKDTSYRVEAAFKAPFVPPQEQGRAIVYWWVRVVRKTGEDQAGKPLGVDISPPSDKRTFITEAKPE